MPSALDESKRGGARSRSILLAIGVALVGALFVAMGWGFYGTPTGATFSPSESTRRMEGAALLSTPHLLSDFQLIDDAGVDFTPSRLEGKWSLLFFGYTHCPDICPITLQSLSDTVPVLNGVEEAVRPQVFFVSVDPEHDTTKRLQEYVDFFHPSFVGVTGHPEQIAAFAGDIGAAFEVHERAPGEDPLVSHASSLFLVDPKVRLAARLDTPRDPERFVDLLGRVQDLVGRESPS